MTIDLTKLRALAAAVTQPGPWTRRAAPYDYSVIDANSFWVAGVGDAPDDAAYIAAAHPQAVLALIDEVERLRATSLTPEEASLCDWGLGVLTIDYNEAPHDDIGALRERLKRV